MMEITFKTLSLDDFADFWHSAVLDVVCQREDDAVSGAAFTIGTWGLRITAIYVVHYLEILSRYDPEDSMC